MEECPFNRVTQPQHTITWQRLKIAELKDTIAVLHGVIKDPNRKVTKPPPEFDTTDKVFIDDGAYALLNTCIVW